MGISKQLWRAAAAIGVAGLVAGCAGGPETAAPVIQKGGPGFAEGAPPAMVAAPQGRRIVVRRGQSLGRIAHEYHVSERAIIAANRLKPPYKIEAGQRLLVPGAAIATAAMAPVAAAPLAPLPPSAVGPTAVGPMAAAPPRAQAGHLPPEIIPLDGPPPAKARAAAPAGSSAGHERTERAEEARAEPAAGGAGAPLPHGGHLPWPVQGRVLAGYGVGAGGAHNDGINIAAPRGAPVHAVEGGTVAYAGNELRGYGNLILVKHPDGLITAYAHCEELLVKKGEQVRPGQIIAKVGATGGVNEPQLHFETRRGKKALDPREFLGPAPSAETAGRNAAG